jgi:hypothetical protein
MRNVSVSREEKNMRAYASLASNIFALRSDIVSVTSVSPTMSPEHSFEVKNLGIQPLTLPPFDSAARAICMGA